MTAALKDKPKNQQSHKNYIVKIIWDQMTTELTGMINNITLNLKKAGLTNRVWEICATVLFLSIE